jgi:oligopeptide transport system substrate-binding protein
VRLSKRSAVLLGSGLAAVMVLSACDGDDRGGSEGSGGGTFSMALTEPENPLVPGNTSENQGSQVIQSLWTGLIQYSKDGEVEYTGVAESIRSNDSTTWTISLEDGWTFHDGTPVTARSFVDAWNYTAYSPNAESASYFFANVQGYDDLQAPTDDAGKVTGDPAATEMSGLQVVDERTFTVTLSAPFAQFPVTLGYNAFFPLPESYFEDPEAAGRQPIGNGPFQAEEEWVPGQGITLTRYEDYAGENAAQADAVDYRVYAEVDTAYTDAQGGNLDIVRDVPFDAIATVEGEFPGRFVQRESSGFTFLGMPTYDPRYADKRVRQGISMAIDRATIADAIFNGTWSAADDAISPVVEAYRERACEYCALDVERANQLLDEAGFDRSQPIELWFNAGASHDAWMEAVGNQLRENIGVDFVLRGELGFSEYLPLRDAKGFTGPFRLSWYMDYPSPQNYLEPLYSTAALPPAGANSSFYSNPEFDRLIAQGNSAPNDEEAIAAYQAADDVLLEDMPILPMFFEMNQAVYSENVDNVTIDIFGHIDTAAVTIN